MTQSPDASPQSDKPRTHTVEELCQRFQQAFQDGKRVRIEDILKKVRSLDNGRLLRGLMIVEVTYRRRQGESPQATEYHSRFPDHPAVVDDTFNMLGKSSRAREEPPRQQSANGIPPVKQAKAPQGDVGFPIEVVEEGDRHRRPAPSSAQKPPARKDQFDLEIVDLPPKPVARRPAPSSGKPTVTGKAPVRKPAGDDDLDDILSQMQPLQPRVKAVRDNDGDDDEEEEEDRPRVKKIRKKRKKKKKSADGLDNPMEYTVPLFLLIASGIINLIFAGVFAPVGVPVWIYILLKSVYIIFTTVVTTMALFAAAAILDTDYGYLSVGLIKIGAICLTQTWLAELALFTPEHGSLLIEVFAWIATYVMFLMFFQLDGVEAIGSMAIVRIAHRIAATFLFIGLMSIWMSGGSTGLEDDAGDVMQKHVEKKLADEIAKEAVEAAPYNAVAKMFGDALMQEKYSEAYALMSEAYRKHTTLEKFTELHKNARKEYGKPLQVETGVGTLDKDSLKDEEYGKLDDIPANIRRAWMHAQLALELSGKGEDAEVERCYDCWMLLIDQNGKLAVGRFEYHWCD